MGGEVWCVGGCVCVCECVSESNVRVYRRRCGQFGGGSSRVGMEGGRLWVMVGCGQWAVGC
jgi:hypothetical protein